MPDVDHTDYLREPTKHLDAIGREWLEPLGPINQALRRTLYLTNRALMKIAFQLQVAGQEHLPQTPPFILTPNHTSSLDPMAIAAAVDYPTLCHTRWAGRKGAVLRNPCRRWLNRLAQTVPVKRDSSALAVAAAVLNNHENLVWFPEGTRTRDGQLQEFQIGIGLLMHHLNVPAVPVWIEGAYEAMPPGCRLPRKRAQIRVRFGRPLHPTDVFDPKREVPAQIDILVEALHARMEALANDRGRGAA